MTQNNLGTAYDDLPSATPEERAQNVNNAIACYKAALEMCKRDEYPLYYAMTQNNLGTAYKALPSATPEERARNVSNAIACYRAALEIHKRDEYPHKFCQTAQNLGVALAEIGEKAAARQYLSSAYELRDFLPDQGKSIEEFLRKLAGDCDGIASRK
jgi:tetratricopeptide (TPR) repeat protein